MAAQCRRPGVGRIDDPSTLQVCKCRIAVAAIPICPRALRIRLGSSRFYRERLLKLFQGGLWFAAPAEHCAAVHIGKSILAVESQCPIELSERALPLAAMDEDSPPIVEGFNVRGIERQGCSVRFQCFIPPAQRSQDESFAQREEGTLRVHGNRGINLG